MRYIIEITMDNAAFFDANGRNRNEGPEVARILRKLAYDCEQDSRMVSEEILFDINGGRVGTAQTAN